MNRKVMIILTIAVLIIVMIAIFSRKKENVKVVEDTTAVREVRIENSVDNNFNITYDIYDNVTGEKIVTLDERELPAAYMYSIDPNYDADPIYPIIENSVEE